MACRYIYKGKTYSATEFDDVLRAMSPAEAAKFMPGIQNVPTAPFVGRTESWSMLAMKRMIRYAAENGYDRISWTTGEQQVTRYREALRKVVDRVEWTKTEDGVHLLGYKDGVKTADTIEKENAVSDAIGKSMADQIKNDPNQSGVLEGDDITISDTGMAAFYDQMLPQMVNKYVKKWSGKVGETTIEHEPANASEADAAPSDDGVFRGWQATKKPVHSLDITPAMRESVMQGQPLFSRKRDAVQSLNDAIAEQRNDNTWRNAYEPAPDDVLAPLREVIRAFESVFGTKIIPVVATSETFEGLPGKFHQGTLFIDANDRHYGFVQLAGHELLHQLKRDQPSMYANLAAQARLFYRGAEGHRDRLSRAGLPGEQEITAEYAEEELLGDFTGDALADPEFLQMLAEANPTRFRMLLDKIVAWLKDVASKLTKNGFGSSQYFTDINELREYLAAALSAYAETKDPGAVGAVEQPLFSRKKKDILQQRQRKMFGLEYTGPISTITKAVVQMLRFDRLTTYLHDVFLKEKLGSLVPEKIKAGVVDRYGVEDGAVDARVMVKINTFRRIREAGTLVEKIATITRDESKILHAIMGSNDKTMIDYLIDRATPEGRQFIEDAKALISQMTQESIDVGLLSPEVAARNANAYVHRSYKKYTELEASKTEKSGRARAMRIMGDAYKGRGMRDDVSMDALKLFTGEWWARKLRGREADVALKGERFIRYERRAPIDDKTLALAGIPEGKKKGKLLEVRYWPESQPPPAWAKDWDVDIAPWEARFFDKKNKVGMFRDFVPAERQALGEIDEVRYVVAKTIIMMAHDIEVAKYFKWVYEKYGKSVAPEGVEVIDGSESLWRAYKPSVWVRVPNSKIPGTDLHVYGAIAGKYLPGPMWNDIRQLTRLKSANVLPDALAAVIRIWKINKTALTPGVHVNNIMGNVMMSYFHDVLGRHVAQALLIMARKSKNPGYMDVYRDFEASGATLGMYAHQELRAEIMDPLEEELRKELNEAAGEESILTASNLLALIKQKHVAEAMRQAVIGARGTVAGRVAAKMVRTAIDAYQIEDEVFRLAAFIKGKEGGMTDAEAGKFAKRSFLDYDITAPWINALRQTILPFIGFPYRAIPMLLETAAHKPWKIINLMLIFGALNALAYAMLGAGGDEDDERRLLPPEKSGKIWGIIPKLMRMPWNHDGAPVFLDIRRWVIVGDVLDVEQSHSAIPLLPSLNPSGPLAMVAEFVANREQFTGKDIVNKKTDTLAEMASKISGWAWRSYMPNMPGLPGTYATTGIVNAGKGKTDVFGREQDLAMAMLSSVGVKIAAYPKDVAMMNAKFELDRQRGEIHKNITGIKYERLKKGITQDEAIERINYQVEKEKELVRKFQERMPKSR